MLEATSGYLPFIYALVAGMATMLSPCSLAMLPSYVAMYILDGAGARVSRARLAFKASYLSLVVGIGYLSLSFMVGLVTNVAHRAVLDVLSWLAVILALGLIFLGVWLLTGHHVSVNVLGRIALRMKASHNQFIRYFLFGIAYGIAALGCTLPVFIMVVVSAFTARGYMAGVVQLLFYGAGMTVVFTGIAVAVVFAREALSRWVSSATVISSKVSGWLLILSGLYIAYYWLMVGGIFSWLE